MRPLAKDDPRQIGPFEIVGLLGGGGMGRVYLGRTPDGRTVAVKTARSELADDRGFRTRFAREVAAARRVGGPFVAPVVDAAPHDDTPWMATDYVPGVSLADAVHDCGPLPERAVRLLTAGLLHALTAVHAHGLVHRDLKPSNILLTAEGPRVIDFGIAYSAADTALTMTGTALGTPGFMAPEQLVMTGPEITGAADVFALGGVIVFAATGGGPYGSAEPQILMYRTVHEEPRLDDLPDGLRELAAGCLAKEPERRPALPALMASAGAPGPYGDWLPDPVAVQLRRLSAQLRDLGSPATLALRPPAAPPAEIPYHQLPTRAADGAPPLYGATPPHPAYTPAPPLPHPPGQTPLPGPSRRRVLAALSAVGAVAGGGALTWALWPDGGGGGASAGNKPSGGTNATGSPGHTAQPSGRLPQQIRDKGIVTVGSDIAYAPMEFTKDGVPAGVDVDLANALGRELGVRFRFENATFDSLLAGLSAGRYDLVMSALTDTRDRQQGRVDGEKTGGGVDLIDYLSAGLALVVRKGNPEGIKNPQGLSGKTVAVQRGTVARDYVDELSGNISGKLRIREFDSGAEIYDDVAKGRSAACLDDFPVAALSAATHSGGDVLERAGEQLDPVPYGIAVAKTQTALRDAVRDALDRLIVSGEYAKILKRWSIEDGAVERAIVNGGR
ncbi:bifunctional serine/threonine-protein kinase/transporter substrate-binding domain-containing protein [Streptomyces sp. NPDC101150]|uniref:bifunctional serine/threonine-protein kinase/transporter substrate-binding domain-containing protein n=1 Tax=Streptomyces sp. NPDC101150 TaxID=3366114 RepID=UPI0037FB6A70